ncbi:stage II sporulation protein M [Candidatus Woesearchaeota archaeon]|nr:stage II sporulation protein M [Candidatus Woesearchaeota archaeon]
MVLESLLNPFQAEKHPVNVILLGILYGFIAVFISLWVFQEQAGMVMVFLAVLAATPLFYHTMIYEEKKDLTIKSEYRILREHGKAILFFIFLFIGMTAAFTTSYLILPEASAKTLFKPQIDTINGINSRVATGNITQTDLFLQIFLNNIKVVVFSLFFSLLFGAGAIFIIVWNSSVIAAAFGSFINTYIIYFMNSGSHTVLAYTQAVTLSLFRYFIHGIPEILAYFVAGLAGGILSAAVIRKDFQIKKMEHIMLDFTNLVLISLIIVFIAGIIEVYTTPWLFSLIHQQLA